MTSLFVVFALGVAVRVAVEEWQSDRVAWPATSEEER